MWLFLNHSGLSDYKQLFILLLREFLLLVRVMISPRNVKNSYYMEKTWKCNNFCISVWSWKRKYWNWRTFIQSIWLILFGKQIFKWFVHFQFLPNHTLIIGWYFEKVWLVCESFWQAWNHFIWFCVWW
jgi:hypothetical protein